MKTYRITRPLGTTLGSTLFCGALLISIPLATARADILKADNLDNLNLGTSWVGSNAPSFSDVAVWNNGVSAANTTSTLGADLNWLGIRIADPAAPVTINAGNTLTLGASGIDLSAATQDLYLSNNVSLGAAQTWNVSVDRTLAVGTLITGANSLTKAGNGTLVLSSSTDGVGGYSRGTILNAGTLQINATSGTMNQGSSAGTAGITNHGATLRFHSSGAVVGNIINFSGTSIVDLNNFTAGAALIGAWSGDGTVLITNLNSAGATFTIGGNGNGSGNMTGFTGTISLGTSAGTLRFNNGGGNNNVGNASATFDLGTGFATFFSRNRGATVNLGELHGGPGTTIRQGASSTGTTTYNIGGKNTDSAFAGQIIDGGTTAAGLIGITKVGTGTLTLTGTNTNLGPTTVSDGTLRIGDGGITGSLGGGAVINNASLVFNRSDNHSVSNAITGQGTLMKLGAGVLTLEGTNSSSGPTLINEGTLALSPAGLISSPIAIATGAALDVTANSSFKLSQSLSGAGTVLGSLTAAAGNLIPGGANAAGTLSFSNGLVELDNVSHQFELSAPAGTNDLLNITGDLTLSGTNFLVVNHFGGGAVPNGTYTLINYSGTLNGTLGNLSAVVTGATGTLTNPPNEIALIITPSSRVPTTLTWFGDGGANNWDQGASSNWKSGATTLTFLPSDSVRFDSTGAANPVVNLNGTLLPASVTVDASAWYRLTGSGAIGGSAALTKTNSGTLTILTTNLYTGPTTVSGGVLAVSMLANGGAASAIGAASGHPTNLVLSGSTLRYTGPSSSTDRGATLNAPGATFEITTDTESLAVGGSLIGPGTLTKAGPGTLTLSAANSYSGGTVISSGVLALGSLSANSSGLGPNTNAVTFFGGTLELFGYNGPNNVNYTAVRNPLVVPAGQNGTLRMFSRGPTDNTGITSSLTGGGTLNLVVNYMRGSLDGDWSAFAGSLVVTGKAGADHFRINNTFGYSNASVYLNDGVIMYRNGGANTTTDVGELSGSAGSFLGLNNVSQNNAVANPTWRVGMKNTSATFAGIIRDDSSTSIIKVGTGTWTLTGINTHSGSTTVSNGVLELRDSGSMDNSSVIGIAAPGILDVSGRVDATLSLGLAAGQTLRGDGTLRGNLSVGTLGTNSPGFSIGTLTVTNAITLGSGSTTVMEINRGGTPKNDKLLGATISLGGTLVVTNIGANLQVGDMFDLFDGPMIGSFESVVLPVSYAFNTNNLTVNGTISVTGATLAPVITSVTQLGGNLVLSGNAGLGLANSSYFVVASTNLAAPLATWTPVQTNLVLPTGNFSATIAIVPGTAQDYFRLLFP